MRKLLTQLSNLVFPPRATEKIIHGATTNTISNVYSPGTYHSHIYLGLYREPLLQACVIENKFHRTKQATDLLAHLLKQWTQNQIMTTLYIPIPLGPKRRRERGYNQVESILDGVGSELAINTEILIRKINTEPQSKLDKALRESNMREAFQFKDSLCDLSMYQQIVIVDDVVTTGATLAAARAELAPHLPPNVTLRCLAIAH